jgi:hypothetical protein
MDSLNVVALTGTLARDPVIRCDPEAAQPGVLARGAVRTWTPMAAPSSAPCR